MSLTTEWRNKKFLAADDVPDTPIVLSTRVYTKEEIGHINALIQSGRDEKEVVNAVKQANSN